VQCLLRQHGSSFAASREFCGDLTACLFLVVFWLAVKIFAALRLLLPKFGSDAIATAWGSVRNGMTAVGVGG